MYKLLLCWRYLLTRYLALACIVSVMLGVATLIVVNSVMAGFSTKLRDRLHNLLSDVVIEAHSLDGFGDPEGKMKRIREDPFLSQHIEAMTATLEVFAMLQFRLPNGEMMTRTVHLIGVDPSTYPKVGGFTKHLVNQKDKDFASFELSEADRERYLQNNPLSGPRPLPSPEMQNPDQPPPPAPPPSKVKIPHGVIVGKLIASYREADADSESTYKDIYLLNPGDSVVLTTVSGQRLAPVYDSFVVVDYFKSEMSEYDSNYVFVSLDYLQHLRTMQGRVTSIQIKLKDYSDQAQVKDRLRVLFPQDFGWQVQTWEDKQGPLLKAIAIEKGILNVLLFLIIGVAGFGILAIFTMIVAEKTRDIGILKSLGASNGGVMSIFLGYGLLLGVVGASLGTMLGLTIASNINTVEQLLAKITGGEVFDRRVYYFDEIPTDIQVWHVVLVAVGSVAIAVLFSVLPALRAALLHPVRALRCE